MSLTHKEEVNLYETIQKSFSKILIKDLKETKEFVLFAMVLA